ncbi:MAG: MarP family serine protease [Actinomycetales bacterium]
MLFGLTLLDIGLILWLLWQLFYGLRVGLIVSLGGILGVVAGAVAAFFAIPLVNSLVTDSQWRVVAVVATVIALVALGHGAGIRLGMGIGRRTPTAPLRAVNRLLGGALTLVVGALMLSVLSLSITNLGIPVISAAIGQSKVVNAIDSLTPDPLKSAVAQVRSLVLSEGIPQVLGQLPAQVPSAPPNTKTNTPALNAAARSVLKITGTAYQCGQNQTGSGFVAAPGRVVTNAHVIAGVSQPVVEIPNGAALPARVVYFDPNQDIAVLDVPGLNVAPLQIGSPLDAGAPAAFDGYPHGGPFQSKPASVQSVSDLLVPDIYGNNPHPEQVYQLSADVQPGNSGGPLLDESGHVVGLVFAKATQNVPVGYAFTLKEVQPVTAKAESLSAPVASGSCTKK